MKSVAAMAVLATLATASVPATASAQSIINEVKPQNVAQCQFYQETIGNVTITTIYNCRRISLTVI